MRVFSLKLPKGFEYHVDVEDDAEVKASVSFPLSVVFNAKKLFFADKFAYLLMEKELKPATPGGRAHPPGSRSGSAKRLTKRSEENMPKYLVELILIVEAENTGKAKEIADRILDMELPSEIEEIIESFRCEEITQIKEGEKTCRNQE